MYRLLVRDYFSKENRLLGSITISLINLITNEVIETFDIKDCQESARDMKLLGNIGRIIDTQPAIQTSNNAYVKAGYLDYVLECRANK